MMLPNVHRVQNTDGSLNPGDPRHYKLINELAAKERGIRGAVATTYCPGAQSRDFAERRGRSFTATLDPGEPRVATCNSHCRAQ